MRDGAKDLEQLMSSRSMHLAKQEECMKKIRDLGPFVENWIRGQLATPQWEGAPSVI